MKYPEDYVNQIVQGDCLKVIKSIPTESIDLIIIDPPYVNVTNESWDRSETVTNELSSELHRISKQSASIYIWCGIGEKSQSLIRWFPIFSQHWFFKDLITWKKNRGNGNKKGWLYTREECMWFVKNNKQFLWNRDEQYSNEKRPWNVYKSGGEMVNKSEYKRLTNVWTDINEVGFGNSPKKFKEIRDKLTYTPKPIEAIERIIKAHTNENDIVLDCFLGSGTTAIASINTNRQFIGIELNPDYCNLARNRIRELYETKTI